MQTEAFTPFRISIAVSASLHALLAMLLLWGAARSVENKKPEPIWLDLNSQLKTESKENRLNRVVQTEKRAKSQEVAPTALLGEHNQIVDRETVSRERVTSVGANYKSNQNSEKAERSKRDLSRLGLSIFPAGSELGKLGTSEENPQDEKRWYSAGGQRVQDYVKGVKEGDRTLLNTKEYVFYGYFQRIRERLDRAWSKNLHEEMARIWRKGRKIASDSDHITKVIVTLDHSGTVKRVQIIEASGTRDLDEAAVKAFNQAGPFPNPPRGIADAEGKIQIRWDFILKT